MFSRKSKGEVGKGLDYLIDDRRISEILNRPLPENQAASIRRSSGHDHEAPAEHPSPVDVEKRAF
jgi:hypothetical protein